MATGSNSFTPDSLLAHEPFVRAVVRNLLKDEHRVQDVLQETWIRALRRAPAEGGPQKGWLAQVARRIALDQHRGSARREQREREVARDEALESVDMLHARLEAQRAVVDAVLALEEPYKSVVLLSYYEQLSPQAIGARLGRSAATVRSQLSRAHEILKHKLDQRHGGERAAWAGVLWPWAITTKSNAGWLVAAGLGAVLVGAGAWMLPRNATTHTAEPAVVALAASSEPSSPTSPLVSEPSGATRESVSAIAQAQQSTATQKPELSTLGREQLRDLAVQAMRTLEKKLYAPDPRFLEQEQALLALPDTGITRVLGRQNPGDPDYGRLILTREAGAYFSFATLSHDYDEQPDVEFGGGELRTGFYGLMTGMIFPIGNQDLARLAPKASEPPDRLSPERKQAWELLFALPPSYDEAGARPFQRRASELELDSAPARKGVTYLVRTLSPGEHDHLVGIQVLEKDKDAVTIAWRIVQRFPAPGKLRRGYQPTAFAEVAQSPAWMESLDIEQLRDLIHELRKSASPALLAVPTEQQRKQSWRLDAAQSSGWFRLVPEDYSPLVEAEGGGSCYSIEHTKYSIMPWDVRMTREFLEGHLLLDLGELERAEYASALRGEALPRLDSHGAEAWRFLWDVSSVFLGSDGVSNRGLRPEDEQRIRSLVRGSAKVIAGHSYLIRPIYPDDTDHLVLLTALEASTDGASFCWRELKRFDR